MGWDSAYLGEDDQRAAAIAEQRRKMSPFERQMLDAVGSLTAVTARLADTAAARQPASPVCPDCGKEQPIWPPLDRLATISLDDVDRAAAVAALTDDFPPHYAPDHFLNVLTVAVDAINRTRSAAGDGGGVSAEPPESAPGSARPDFHAAPEWIRDLLKDFDDWCGDQPSTDGRSRDQLIDDFLAAMVARPN